MRIVKMLLRAGAAVNSENLKGQVRFEYERALRSVLRSADFLRAELTSLSQTPVDLAFQLNFVEVGEYASANYAAAHIRHSISGTSCRRSRMRVVFLETNV
jgi:hypothetical protein